MKRWFKVFTVTTIPALLALGLISSQSAEAKKQALTPLYAAALKAKMSIAQATELLGKKIKGKALRVGIVSVPKQFIKRANGNFIYEFDLLTSAGKLTSVQVQMDTGKVVGQQTNKIEKSKKFAALASAKTSILKAMQISLKKFKGTAIRVSVVRIAKDLVSKVGASYAYNTEIIHKDGKHVSAQIHMDSGDIISHIILDPKQKKKK